MPEPKRIYYKAGYKYQLHRTYHQQISIRLEENIATRYISLSADGELEIKYGYAWDGPSGTTWDTPNSMRASLVHDALYQLLRMGKLPHTYKDYIDVLFERVLREDGMSSLRARIWYRGVDQFGEDSTLPDNQKEVFVAPKVGYLGGL